ncbi:MAG: hypothetical protein ACRDN6_07630 [Gaiellaceae bacterium]
MSETVDGAGTLGVEIHRTEVDGVPVFWAETPEPFTACVYFRVGRVDETFATAGITHMVEHLAMPAHDLADFEMNAAAGTIHTSFYATGTREEVAGFLQERCEQLAGLPLERLEAERRILRSEEVGASESAYVELYGTRFGAARHGLVVHDQWGLRRLEAQEVAAWTAAHFTAENAVVWMTGPPPETLSLPLPHGRRVPPPEPAPIPWLALPGSTRWGSDGISASFLAERSVDVRIAANVARDRAQALLRYDLGVTYSVGLEYDPLTSDAVHVFLVADALEGHLPEARDGFLAVLDEVASAGPSPEELERELKRTRRWLSDPLSTADFLDYTATNELVGGPVQTKEQILGEEEAVSPESAAGALARALETALVLAPEDLELPARFPRQPPWVEEAVPGKRYTPSGLPFRRRKETVVLGETGISYIDEEGPGTILFEDCVGVLEYTDRTRGVVREDGRWLSVSADGWRGGDDLIHRLDALRPARLAIPMGEPYA